MTSSPAALLISVWAAAAAPGSGDIILAAALQADGGVPNLPYARGRRFATLDEYLAYLRRYAGAIGQPWYREVRPGLYRLERGNLQPAQPTYVTREQLERRFGFRR